MVESLFSRVREEAFCIPLQEIDGVLDFLSEGKVLQKF